MNENSQSLVGQMHSDGRELVLSMFRITTEKKRGKVVLTVEGRLAGQGVSTFEQCWRELRAASPDEKFNVNLCGVSFIDAAGRALLKEIHREGGRLVAEGCLNQAIVKEIVGQRGKDRDKGENESKESGKDRSKGPHIFFYLALFSLLVTPALTRAQDSSGQNVSPHTPSEVMRLTLDQAVATALKQNTTAAIAVLTAAQTEQDRRLALSALLP